jgi:hypothetical protein
VKDYQSRLDSFTNYADKKRIESYLNKFWLDREEFNKYWLKIKNNIFNPDFKLIPEPVFNTNYENIILKGGSVLYKDEFERLQSCMQITGDKYFIIFEDYDEKYPPNNSGHPYRLKFQINILWEDIMSGAELSSDIFQRPIRNYFIFGDSGQWGKYVANDYEYPLDITGFNKIYSDLFRSKFKNSKRDIKDLKRWLRHYGMKLPDA